MEEYTEVFVLGYSSAAERVSGIYLVVGGRLRCERGVSISSVKLYFQRTITYAERGEGRRLVLSCVSTILKNLDYTKTVHVRTNVRVC